MMHEPAALDRASIVQSLLRRTEREARMRRAGGPRSCGQRLNDDEFVRL